ncbi:hypothetical protein CsSME_00051837 [Camellia sinensis var. sinensis]
MGYGTVSSDWQEIRYKGFHKLQIWDDVLSKLILVGEVPDIGGSVSILGLRVGALQDTYVQDGVMERFQGMLAGWNKQYPSNGGKGKNFVEQMASAWFGGKASSKIAASYTAKGETKTSLLLTSGCMETISFACNSL